MAGHMKDLICQLKNSLLLFEPVYFEIQLLGLLARKECYVLKRHSPKKLGIEMPVVIRRQLG